MGAETNYKAEQNLYGRHGKLFAKRSFRPGQQPNGQGLDGGELKWLSNVTEINATMTVDRLEVRRSGDRFVRYKSGEITGEGTMTMDKVNSYFEKNMIEFIGRDTTQSLVLPEFVLIMSIEDPDIDGIDFGGDVFARKGHEQVVISGVNFWSLPLGFSLSDMITRDLDFTFTDVAFGGDDNQPAVIFDQQIGFNNLVR